MSGADKSAQLREQGLRSLRRLEEQGHAMARSMRPESNPVDDAFKPPEPLPHSYIVASSRPTRVMEPKTALVVPAVLQKNSSKITEGSGRMEPTSRSQPMDSSALHGSTFGSTTGGYQKARRYNRNRRPAAPAPAPAAHRRARARNGRCVGGTSCPSTRG